jgi:secondary thiamine-phosphate synthase enzyme
MDQAFHTIVVRAPRWLAGRDVGDGVLTVFVRHTSASLLIQENVSPDVLVDLEAFFRDLVPESGRTYAHDAEGADDMPAHVKGALTQTSLSVPVRDGGLRLGRYQGIFLWEHRRRPRDREIDLHYLGN